MKGLLVAAPRREEVQGAEGSPLTRPHTPGRRPGCAAHLLGQPNPWPAPWAGIGETKPLRPGSQGKLSSTGGSHLTQGTPSSDTGSF